MADFSLDADPVKFYSDLLILQLRVHVQYTLTEQKASPHTALMCTTRTRQDRIIHSIFSTLEKNPQLCNIGMTHSCLVTSSAYFYSFICILCVFHNLVCLLSNNTGYGLDAFGCLGLPEVMAVNTALLTEVRYAGSEEAGVISLKVSVL